VTGAGSNRPELPSFSRRFFGAAERFTRIGGGPVGGKAAGLLLARDILAGMEPPPRVAVEIPTLTVIAADMFEWFLEQNRLADLAVSGTPDDRIALAFQQADLPVTLLGDLRALVEQVRSPLAVRSSSELEDSLDEPFAGIYATKMIPNNQPDPDTRFRRLVEAIKLVYASTFFADAVAYRRALGRGPLDDRMAVILQEVVGRRHETRYYPDVSGVARSYSFYRSARARPEQGVVTLALGLGRTIVDEGIGWSYSPAHPKAPPPIASPRDLADTTQQTFWAVNMGPPPPYDPIRETEYLVRADLDVARADGTLRCAASTWDAARDRLIPGDHAAGPRVLNFAPLLVLGEWPVNDAVRRLLAACEAALDAPVDIEFAITFDREADRARLGFLQVRPMAVAKTRIEVTDEELAAPEAVVASRSVLGNGTFEPLHDVVYVRPETFDPRHAAVVAADVAALAAGLHRDRTPYVLIGFGRWGSSDPWLGLQVTWPQISGAVAIVEAALPARPIEMSQGSHFFHNIASRGVSYFSVAGEGERIDWDWLARQPAVHETGFVRHARTTAPLAVKVDGRTGRGIVMCGD
jgi:hypothetical protein